MRRRPLGKRLEITQRDVEIFKLLERYRYLRSTYIHAFVGGASETRFKERLGDLFHEAYIDRPNQQWEFANARHSPVVYELGAGARRALQEVGSEPSGRCTFLAEGAHRQFLHSLMICEVLASFELATRAKAGLRFIGWPEILAKAPDATQRSDAPFRLPVPSGGALIPDGLFGIEYAVDGARKYRFFALEADRGTMPLLRSGLNQSSYLAKLATYHAIIGSGLSRSHWALPNLFVLTITSGEIRLANMIRQIEKLKMPAPTFLFAFAAGGKTPLPDFLCRPWRRISLPDLSIDRS